MAAAIVVVVVLVLLMALLVLAASIKIVQEYERGVIFRLGRCVGAKGPGVFFVVPIIDKIVRVNLQEIAVNVQPQQAITRDNVTLNVDAVAFMRVVDPVASVVKVQNWYQASSLLAQTTLRSVIGHRDLDELLSSRDVVDAELREILDAHTDRWGVEVGRVELRDLDLPEQIQRAMGRQAEAERDRRAKVIAADGELQASQKIADAARTMAIPGAMQLRSLQTMTEISAERNSTIIFPIPTEIMDAFRSFTEVQEAARAARLDTGGRAGPSGGNPNGPAAMSSPPAPPTPPTPG